MKIYKRKVAGATGTPTDIRWSTEIWNYRINMKYENEYIYIHLLRYIEVIYIYRMWNIILLNF